MRAKRLVSSLIIVGAATIAGVAFAGCTPSGRGAAIKSKPVPKPLASSSASSGFASATRCDSTSVGRELSYHDLAGRGVPDMVEVLYFPPGRASEGRIVCMELDTNHDGVLDLLRVFNEKGELDSEEADRNYDGKSDVWLTYETGVMIRQDFDVTFHGAKDEWDYYSKANPKDPSSKSQLKRIERDRNDDGKVDTWEYYVNGKLERMGLDTNGDGRVDTWYRDEVARAEQIKTAQAAAAASASAAAASAAASAAAAGVSAAPSTSTSAKLPSGSAPR
jgi:hypothetical protein